jgi:nucleotide-binding universal stress UspA family protein
MVPIETVLHPTDFSPRSEHALDVACALARDYGATLVLVHVLQSHAAAFGEFGTPDPVVSVATLKGRLRQLAPHTLAGRVKCHVREGHAATEILRLAKETRCDIIVMGTHGRTGLGRLVMGSVAEQVVRMAPCAVLTVKAPFLARSEAPEAGVLETVSV